MIKASIRVFCLVVALAPLSAPAQDELAKQEYSLGAGDDIRIQVFQNPDLSLETRVSESGTISYPLIGKVKIGGQSVSEAEHTIAIALRQGGFVNQPQVSILLTQVRANQVSVLGQVNRPGRFPLETMNIRVSDMLAMAGGATAAGDDVVILTGQRDGKPFRQEIDIPELYRGRSQASDPVLAGGDTLFIDRAPVFYIYGETQRPGQYRIERGMTIRQALAQGGGPTPRGSEYRLRLHRRNADDTIEKSSPEMSDPVQANDVIYVRESLF